VKFLIIIPAHNEEANIFYCLKSLEKQNYQNFELMIVDDGSTDNSFGIIETFIQQSPIKARIKTLRLEKSNHQPGAKVVRTFHEGLNAIDVNDFDIICKFDADIVFPENYLAAIQNLYKNNPKTGMASGIVKIWKNGILDLSDDKTTSLLFNFSDDSNWEFENISSKNHVRGPIKSYRKNCFLAIKGLRPVLGWDNLDVALAQMHGYEVQTDKDIWVKHLRPTAFKYKNQKAEKLGEYFYNLGLNLPLTCIASAKSAWKSRSFSEFWITLKSFLHQNHPLVITKEEIQYIRQQRWKKMFEKLKFYKI
jgi:glycosyltransferase involved in cell wall biosynthesis